MIKSLKLLISEDEPELRSFLNSELSALNFTIVNATNGVEAHKAITTDTSIVAVLSDIRMPGMTGIECLKKTREQGIEVPFVFLTGFADKAYLTDAIKYGATDFLEKPCQPSALFQTVKQAIRLGIVLKGVANEFSTLAKKYNISEADQNRFYEQQRTALSLKIDLAAGETKKSAA